MNGDITRYASVSSTGWMVDLNAGVEESPVAARDTRLRLLNASRVPAFSSGFSGDTFDVEFGCDFSIPCDFIRGPLPLAGSSLFTPRKWFHDQRGIIATVLVLCLFISLPVGIFWLEVPAHLSNPVMSLMAAFNCVGIVTVSFLSIARDEEAGLAKRGENQM